MKNLIIITTFLLIIKISFSQENCVSCIGNDINTFGYSSAIGVNNYSLGSRSFASGEKNSLKGNYASALGFGNSSNGESAFAAGSQCSSAGKNSIALGEMSQALGRASFAAGFDVMAKSPTTFAIGSEIDVWGSNSIAIGHFLKTTVSGAFVIGYGAGTGDNYLMNTTTNSLMIGFKSTNPTFFVGESPDTDKTGRIGIGNVTNPLTKLHIKADPDEEAIIRLTPDEWSGSKTASLEFGDVNYGIVAHYSQGLTFNSNNKDFIFNTGAIGEVGIGTSYPTQTLDVDGTSRIRDDARFDGNVGIGITTPSERLEVNGNILQSSGYSLTTSQIKAPDATGLSLTDMNGYGIFVDDGGNVGIGTVNPIDALQLGERLIFHTDAINLLGYNYDYIDFTTTQRIAQGGVSAIQFEQDGNIVFQTAISAAIGTPVETWNYPLTLKNDGRVSIGNINPAGSYLLSVDGDIYFEGQLYNNEGLVDFSPWTKKANNDLYYENGKVGIGTSTPGSELDVNGTLTIRDNANIGEGFRKLSIGSAYLEGLGWGNTYIGFNIERESVNTWITTGGNTHGGASLIYGTMLGDLVFACIDGENTGGQILDDEDVHTNVKMILKRDGVLKTNEVQVKTNVWSDYVFNDDYNLKPLEEVEEYINEHNHLPDVPSEKEVIENGIKLGEMDALLMKKIEELTLYVIELKKENMEMKGEIEKLKK